MRQAVADPGAGDGEERAAASVAQPPASPRTLPDGMDRHGDTDEQEAPREQEAEQEQEGAPPRSGGWRLWTLRVFVLTLLLTGAGTVAVAAVTIVKGTDGSASARTGQFGVVMPDAARYREVVGELLARDRPRQLRGLTVTGEAGEVAVLRAQRKSATTFPSSYLNPGALALIARSIGVRSDTVITVDELRLEKLRATGRLRWRLRGEQAGRPWRAVIAPNGTALRLLPTKAT